MQRLHFFHNRLIIVLSILLLLVLTLGLPGTQTQAAPPLPTALSKPTFLKQNAKH